MTRHARMHDHSIPVLRHSTRYTTGPGRHRARPEPRLTARARADLMVAAIVVFAFAMHVAAQTLVGGA